VWTEQLDDDSKALFGEVYVAMQNGSGRLAMMGARALLDLYIVKKVGDVGSFNAKLKRLKESTLISGPQFDVLNAALDAGSAAAHRGHAASDTEVGIVMDILENVIHLDLLAPVAEQLRQSIPRRGSRGGPAGETPSGALA
jgi:hypothetical protein